MPPRAAGGDLPSSERADGVISSLHVSHEARHRGGFCGTPRSAASQKADMCRRSAREEFRFRDLGAPSAMAVRLLGPPAPMSFRLAIGRRRQLEEEPDPKLNGELDHDSGPSLRRDECEAMLIYSMSVSADGFIADREGGFGLRTETQAASFSRSERSSGVGHFSLAISYHRSRISRISLRFLGLSPKSE